MRPPLRREPHESRPWKLWTLDGKPADGTEEIVTVLESVLRRNPDHVGANHYYIHTVEASLNPARALPSAKRLEMLAPAAGHLVHMPAHIYARTGDHAGAARANLAGAEADRVYLKTAPADSFYGMAYYSHNLHFLTDSYMMQGALPTRSGPRRGRRTPVPHAQMMPMVESMIVAPVSVLLRFNRHDEVLQLPAAGGRSSVDDGVVAFRAGRCAGPDGEGRMTPSWSAARSNRRPRACPARRCLGERVWRAPGTVLSLAKLVLDARMAGREGRGRRISAVETRLSRRPIGCPTTSRLSGFIRCANRSARR